MDKYIRQLGVIRVLDARMQSLTPEENTILMNYAAGVNKVVKEL